MQEIESALSGIDKHVKYKVHTHTTHAHTYTHTYIHITHYMNTAHDIHYFTLYSLYFSAKEKAARY
jgi:hypothetical protein